VMDNFDHTHNYLQGLLTGQARSSQLSSNERKCGEKVKS
jgi:hypothetical protein